MVAKLKISAYPDQRLIQDVMLSEGSVKTSHRNTLRVVDRAMICLNGKFFKELCG